MRALAATFDAFRFLAFAIGFPSGE